MKEGGRKFEASRSRFQVFRLQSSRFKLPVCGYRSYMVSFIAMPVLLSAGCRDRALEQAQQEAREAKATINKLNYNLKGKDEKIATLEAELNSVKQIRDELQKQVDRLGREREQASTFARQAQEAITRLNSQAEGQTSTTVALQKQVAELKTLVDEQQKLIEQLQKGTAAPPVTPPPAQTPDKPTVPEPNQKP